MKINLIWNEKHRGKIRKLRGALQIYYDTAIPLAPLTIKINAPVMLRWLALFAVLGYFVLAGALYTSANRNPASSIDAMDMLLPWKWSQWREALAEKPVPLPKSGPPATPIPAPIITAALPPPPTPAPTSGAGSGAVFLAHLNQLIAARDWTAADRLLLDTRHSAPPWFAPLAPVLAWREIRIAFELGDKLRAGYLVGQRLHFQKGDSGLALDLARESLQRGDREGARILAVKVLEQVPELVAARKFLESLDEPKN